MRTYYTAEQVRPTWLQQLYSNFQLHGLLLVAVIICYFMIPTMQHSSLIDDKVADHFDFCIQENFETIEIN